MRKPLPVLRRTLRESWRGLVGWTLGVAGVLFLYLPLFPSIGGNSQLQQIIDSLPPDFVNALGYEAISTGAGYTQSTFYGLIGFLLLAIASVSWGSAGIAGAEESGRLELDLAHGIGRAAYALQTAASLVLRLVWLGLVAAAIVAALNEPAQLDIEPARLLDITLALVGLTLLSGSVALLVGALTGRRIWATTAGAGAAVMGYALNAVANQAADLDWLRYVSPYSWAFYRPPLAEGADPAGLLTLWALSVTLIALSVLALRRRDIT